jgi:hypothetical protein
MVLRNVESGQASPGVILAAGKGRPPGVYLWQSQTSVGPWIGHETPGQLEAFDGLQRLIGIGVDDDYVVRAATRQ